jgi:hypothetical protein
MALNGEPGFGSAGPEDQEHRQHEAYDAQPGQHAAAV